MIATGFSMRASGPVLYVMPGYSDFSPILTRIGPHKLGKSCLYLKNLNDINLDAVAELIHAGLSDLQSKYAVTLK